MSTILLPAEEDTQVEIKVKGKASVILDIFELEDLFIQAQSKGDDMGTSWKAEFPKLYKNKTKADISQSQAVLLWDSVKNSIIDLKKSLQEESVSLQKQASPSSRKTKKKSG